MANYKLYGNSDDFAADTDKLRRGDIVGVTGHPAKTKKGELSVVPQKLQVLTPCLHMLPSMHYGLKDKVRMHLVASVMAPVSVMLASNASSYGVHI